jgi:hypothetical protein
VAVLRVDRAQEEDPGSEGGESLLWGGSQQGG